MVELSGKLANVPEIGVATALLDDSEDRVGWKGACGRDQGEILARR
jgi:hypothetical protein